LYDFVGRNSGEKGTYYINDYNNFAPQIGFAWSPNFENGFLKWISSETGNLTSHNRQ
jgi:hypothetical protein